jgi:protein SCO1/2
MKKWWLLYVVFFVLLLTVFWFFIFKDNDFSQSSLAVVNNHVQPFSFINQNKKTITEKDVEGKVYITNYFFTTCKAICPKMNANIRRIYDVFKDDKRFMIISHTCMPEVDSVTVLKQYEQKMINGKLVLGTDGLYKIEYDSTMQGNIKNSNWNFVTGDKSTLYSMAQHSYLINNTKIDTTEKISDQFIHTQLVALLDKQRRVRGIYDGLKENEIQKLLADIKSLLNEKPPDANLINGFSNTPN